MSTSIQSRNEFSIEPTNDYEDGDRAVQFHDLYRGKEQSRLSGDVTVEDDRVIVENASGRVPPSMKPRFFDSGYEEIDPVPEDVPEGGCVIIEVGARGVRYAYAQTREEAESWL